MLKKITAVLLLALLITGCSAPAATKPASETMTIEAYNGSKEAVAVEVPVNPERIAVLDMAVLDILDTLDEGDNIVGSADVSLEYLNEYKPGNENEIANLGTIKEADLATVAAAQPDVIFIGGRLAASYDALSEIAPVVYLPLDTSQGVIESTMANAKTIASIFNKEDQVEKFAAEYLERAEKLAETAASQNAVVGLYSGNSLSLLGPDGRASLITNEAGFKNMAGDETTSTHGNEASWETITDLNPDYMFILDRNTAIGDAASPEAAADAIENELIKNTKAYQNGQIIYLAHPAIWYTAEGGIQALDYMLADLEEPVLNPKE